MKRPRRSVRPMQFRGRRNRHARNIHRVQWRRDERSWIGARLVETVGELTQTSFKSVARISFISTIFGETITELRGINSLGERVIERCTLPSISLHRRIDASRVAYIDNPDGSPATAEQVEQAIAALDEATGIPEILERAADAIDGPSYDPASVTLRIGGKILGPGDLT